MIDPESQQFIDWTFKNLDDETFYRSLVDEAFERARSYYDQPRAEILEHLKAKMKKGAEEHGAPQHTLERIATELSNEYLDLIGWLLVEKWNKR